MEITIWLQALKWKNKAIIVSNFGTVQYIEKILDTRKM